MDVRSCDPQTPSHSTGPPRPTRRPKQGCSNYPPIADLPGSCADGGAPEAPWDEPGSPKTPPKDPMGTRAPSHEGPGTRQQPETAGSPERLAQGKHGHGRECGRVSCSSSQALPEERSKDAEPHPLQEGLGE